MLNVLLPAGDLDLDLLIDLDQLNDLDLFMLVIYIRMLILIFDLDQTVGDLPNLCLKYLNMRFQGSRGFISAPGCGRGTRRRRRGAEPSP